MSKGPTSPLRIAIFRNFWFAGLVANFGATILIVAASWQMTSIAQSAHQVALVQTFAALPIVLLSVAAGAIADILDRRKVMILSQSFVLLASASLTMLVMTVGISPNMLLFFVFSIGCGVAIHGPAWQASVGDQVPLADIPAAVALNSLSLNLARSFGPALGGVLIAVGGVSASVATSTLTCVGLIVVLIRWKPAKRDTAIPRETLASAMLAGVRFAKLSPLIPTLLLRGFLFGAGAVALPALLPLIARQSFNGGAVTFGILLGSYGTGAILGALTSAALRTRFLIEALVKWSSVTFAFSSIAVAFSESPVLSAIVLLPAGACWVIALLSLNVSAQLSAPRWVVGRVLALFQMVTFSGISGGSWVWGLIAERQNLQVALLLAAFALLVCYAIGFWLPVEGPGDKDLTPRSGWTIPQTAGPVPGSSGPVVVEIHWQIGGSDVPRFSELMLDRRRTCLRNGAYCWTLARDTLDPENWFERYEVATWTDYLRLNERVTRDDAGYFEKLAELEKTGRGPAVRRMIVHHPRVLAADAESASSTAAMQRSSHGF